jgi:hypothetical protein
MTRRRVLLALRQASQVERLLSVATGLCRRMDAELEVLADPTRPDWSELEGRLDGLRQSGTSARLTAKPAIDARAVVEHARSHECVVSVVVGRPKAWAGNGADPWSRLDCPLVAATDHPDWPEET